MIEAELSHKIDNRSEDVLTSTVFGLLKYSFAKDLLISFLGKAQSVSDPSSYFSHLIGDHLLFAGDYRFVFWKYFDRYGEPDLIIEGPDYVIIIEVKYLSGLSGELQLENYHNLMENKYKKKANKYLIFLTADLSIPGLPASTINLLKDKNFFWLSWYELNKAILSISMTCGGTLKEISADLLRLLKESRNIVEFEGFSKYNIMPRQNYLFWKQRESIFSQYRKAELPDPIFFKGE